MDEPARDYVTEDHVFALDDGDLISDVLVLGLVIDAEGVQGVLLAGAGMGAVTKLGLVEGARRVLDSDWSDPESDR